MSFNFQPTLSSSLIKIRPLDLSDKERLYNVAADPLIWEQHPVPNRYQKMEFENFFTESIASGGALIVIDAQSHRVIGSSRYYAFNAEKSEVEIGWSFLARSHWGGKYNAELKKLMLEHAFQYVSSVVFYIDPENKRSQKAIAKLGGIKDTRRDNQGRFIYRVKKAL